LQFKLDSAQNNFTEEERKKFLGESQEVNSAHRRILEKSDEITAWTADIRKARALAESDDSELNKARRRMDKSGDDQAIKIQARASQRREQTREKRHGSDALLDQAAIDDTYTYLENRGSGPVERGMATMAMDAADSVGAPRTATSNVGTGAADLARFLMGSVGALERAAKSQEEAAKDQRDAMREFKNHAASWSGQARREAAANRE
jgi:hypothetical protein